MWKSKFAAVIALGVAGVVGLESLEGTWKLATDVQKYYRCLPFNWYLVTSGSQERNPSRGDLVQFRPPHSAARFSEQFEVIKIVAGESGDSWQIKEDKLFVNDELWGDLHLMTLLGYEPGALDGEGTVPQGHVYVLGTNPSSYDSRYWGPLPKDHVTGYAHVIL